MNPFGASAPQQQTLLPGSVTNATEYTLKLLVDDDTNDIYVISKVANSVIDPGELARLKTVYVQKVFANNKKIDGGINNFVNIGFDTALGDIPAPGAAPLAAVVDQASVMALLTTVRNAVDAGAPGANNQADILLLAGVTAIAEGVAIVNEVFVAAVPGGGAPPVTNADVVARLDNAIAEVVRALPAVGVSNQDKAIAAIRAVGFAPIAGVGVDAIRNGIIGLITAVQISVTGAGDDAAYNALAGGNPAETAVLNTLRNAGGRHPAATRADALNKLTNAIDLANRLDLAPGDNVQAKAEEVTNNADTDNAIAVIRNGIIDLITAVQISVTGAGDDAAYNALAGGNPDENAVLEQLRDAGGVHNAATKAEALIKLDNALYMSYRSILLAGDNIQDKAVEITDNAEVVNVARMPGGNKYTYGKQKAYPKNVTFSKKTTSKQTHKKTIRKLQKIINNILL
jgi:hypothetical protein